LGEVHEDVRWLTTRDVIVVRVVSSSENDVDNLALIAIDESVLNRKVVEQKHWSAQS